MDELESLSESCFVVLVSILGNSKRYYKVDSNYLSGNTTINDKDLECLSLEKDYIRVRVVVQNLKSLELCHNSYDDDDNNNYFHHPDIDDRSYFDDAEVSRITLFNEN